MTWGQLRPQRTHRGRKLGIPNMAFVVPAFPITVAFWRHGNATSNPPDVTSVGNLSPGRIVSASQSDVDLVGGPDPVQQCMWLRLPKGTDVQSESNGIGGDTCECPYTSGRFYYVINVDDIGGGFTNEHRFAVIAAQLNWPIPFPPVGGFTPIVPPVPPVFISAFSSLPGGSAGFTFNYTSAGGSIGGCFCCFNDTAIPTVSINGGANCVRTGALLDVNYVPGLGPQMHLYPFLDVGIVGVNTIHVQSGSIGVQLFMGYASAGMGTGTALTGEGAASGIAPPPTIPPYTSNPAHPKVHMVYAMGQNPFGAQGWNAPFSLYGASSPAVAALTPVQLWAGSYLAGVGGQFPAIATGTVGAWVAIQHSYVP